MKVTTSWDDGTADDVKIAALLDAYNLKGTFYLCPKVRQKKVVLTSADITAINRNHEIGAHTMSHPHLTKLSETEAMREIEESKQWVESVTDVPCTMFCYPYGSWNESVKTLVARAGFSGARTTKPWCFHHDDPFLLPTTLQVRPFPMRKEFSRWWHRLDPLGPIRYNALSLCKAKVPFNSMGNWLSLAKALFLKAQKTNGHFHVWGHSSEVQKLDMWKDLEALFAFIATHDNVHPVVNSELLS